MTVNRRTGWRFYAAIVAAAVVAAVGYGTWRAAVDLVPPAWAPSDARPYTVTRVVDGDTVVARDRAGSQTVRIRYVGIDAPEVADGEPFAQEATAANREMVEGRRVWVSTDVQETDEHGRRLGYVFADGRFVNRELVARGYAEVMLIFPNVRYGDELVAAQAEARAEGRGMWGDVREPGEPGELERYAGAVVRLRGDVTGILPGGEGRPTMFWIRPFPVPVDGDGGGEAAGNGDHDTDDGGGEGDGGEAPSSRPSPTVTVLVFPEFRDRFPQDMERDLPGRTVEVTGRLQVRNGRFQMVLREPGQLRVLAAAVPAAA